MTDPSAGPSGAGAQGTPPPAPTTPPVAPTLGPPSAPAWSTPGGPSGEVPGPPAAPIIGGPPAAPPPYLGSAPTPPAAPEPRRGRGMVRAALIGGLVGAVVAGGVTAAALWDRNGSRLEASSVTVPSRPSATVATEDLDIQELLNRVGPSVVSIHTGVRGGEAAGSGVVISDDGVVLTNAHVIEGASSIEVDFADGRTAEARLLGSLPEADVAVIQAEGLDQPVTSAELGTSADLQVGDSVVAIGNALNLGEAPSVTTGIVSALNRSIQTPNGDSLDDLIQTDAAINPGNSGGPLINSKGQVVGINTAILANAQNIGFALSIDSIRDIVEDLRAGKQVENVKPLLGVETVDVGNISDEVADRYSIEVSSGAFVQRVSPGSGAEGAGLAQGDVIVSVDGKRVRTAEDVGQAVRAREPGDRVEIVYVRNGQEQRGTATLGSS